MRSSLIQNRQLLNYLKLKSELKLEFTSQLAVNDLLEYSRICD